MPDKAAGRRERAEMKRMTYVTESGSVLFTTEDCPEDKGYTITGLAADGKYMFLEDIANHLARVEQLLQMYQDTGLTPERIIEMDNLYAEKCKELAEVKKLIPPCKVGDTLYQPVYSSITKVGDIEEMKVLEVSDSRIWAGCDCFDHDDLGKTVFLTQAEAEEALKKMKGMEEQ